MNKTGITKVIDLKTFSMDYTCPYFGAFYCETAKAGKDIFSLTPRVMQWDESTWLFDLSPCRNFWTIQKEKKGKNLYELFEQILDASFEKEYLSVFADHPWQSLLFANFLLKKRAKGVFSLNTLLNRRIYESLSWDHWFEPLATLSDHLTYLKVKGFKESHFRSKQAQLKRFIKRLDLWGPFDLSQADVASIERRFSGWLGEVWAWTFSGLLEDREQTPDLLDSAENQIDPGSFPWIPFRVEDPPRAIRHLEYPVNRWDVIEPLLTEDFSKLCAMKSWSEQERVSSIIWAITLYNLEELKLDLSFRNPYSLHMDSRNNFKTALYQAYYAYMGLMDKLKARDTNLDLPEEIPFVSWKVEINERLYISPQTMELISNENSWLNYEGVLDLQNKIPLPIESYVVVPDFTADLSFRSHGVGVNQGEYDFSLNQWIEASFNRPFFYYRTPLPITSPPESKPKFLERTSNDWWASENLMDITKDYFLVEDREGRFIWVFRNSSGVWYKHGIYS
jgi:hypothetical protein